MTSIPVRTIHERDRCDRCGAQAFVRANVEGVNLFFCGHHFHKHEDAIRKAAVVVIDERHFINRQPSTSANAD